MLPRAIFADKKSEAACKHSGNCTHSQESFLHITIVHVFVCLSSQWYSLVEPYPLQQ